jgi:GAF domain-containing protein
MNIIRNENPTLSSEAVRNWRQGFIRMLLILGLIFGLVGAATGIASAKNAVTIGVLVASYLLLLAVTVLPFPYVARVLVILGALYGVGVNELFLYGILGDTGLYFFAMVVIATLMLSPRAGWYATGMSLLPMSGAGVGFLGGFITIPASYVGAAQLGDWLSNLAMFIVFCAVVILGMQKLQTEIAFGETQARQAVGELEQSRRSLEERIQLRTADLETARTNSERRARQFEAIAQVARVIASIQNLEALLPRITQVISQQFGYYHVGIFMIDSAREYAVLKAANTEGGQKMLARGHSLKVGQTGIVGYVAGTGNPRIAMNAGEDIVFFNNPDLPQTRSEMALPLRIGRELIGVLDVQSVEVNAFKPEDVDALSTLADQAAIAIQNAGSFREAQELIAEAQRTTSQYIAQAWRVLRPAATASGYRSSGTGIQALEKPLEGGHIEQAMRDNQTVLESHKLAVPIRLRGQVVGVINLQSQAGRTWSADEVDIAEAVSERLALALETSTLLRVTQHRADVERITTDITGKLSSSIRIETIIQTAAEELSRALGGSDITVQIQPLEGEAG